MKSAIKPFPPLPAEDLDSVFLGARSCWEEIRNQAILFSGGTGFVGTWLLESFAEANTRLGLGAHAVVISRDPGLFSRKLPHLANRADISLIGGDVRTFAFPPGRFRFIIHAAATTAPAGNPHAAYDMLDTIVSGTRHMLDVAARCGAQKFLLVSSGAVYGVQPPAMSHLTEEYLGAPDPLLAASAYGQGKRIAEQMCALAAEASGIEVKIARCFSFVGPHLPLDAQFAIGNFLCDAMADRPIRIRGNGNSFRSYLYAADLARWLWTILFRGGALRAYNVGSRNTLTIAELARLVQITVGGPNAIQIGGPTGPGLSASHYVPEVTRAVEELGLGETLPLPEAIRRTVAWWRVAAA